MIVRYMLQHIEQHDQIVIAILQRHVGQVAALERQAAALLREGAGMIVGFDRIHRAESLQHGQVRARAGPHLKDAQRPRFGAERFDQRGKDLAAADEPPMVAIDLSHAVINGAIHQPALPLPPIRSRMT